MWASSTISRESVVALYTRMLGAWNQRDAELFATLFTDTGSVVGFDGSQMNGRAEIATELRAIFESHPTAAYVARVREIRPLDENVALLRAAVGMISPGTTELNPAVNAIQSVVIVWPSTQPLIALLHNTPAAFHGRPHLSEQMTRELAEVLRSGRTVEAG